MKLAIYWFWLIVLNAFQVTYRVEIGLYGESWLAALLSGALVGAFLSPLFWSGIREFEEVCLGVKRL